ncbi:hypothetical protein V5799_029348 [Amblyomma americanum]|uniref:Uncharacterized protein n=1 Tax=Amblyomma americanum TaxID=6943 RepID=A0AAQ4ER94_AMBAM
MDDFMRLAGVVRERVKCHAFEDGRAQLVSLNEYCWSAIRRYLDLYDIEEWPEELNETLHAGRRARFRLDLRGERISPRARRLLPSSSTLRFQPAAWK